MTVPALDAESITDANETHELCKGIYIGVAGNYDFYMNGAWIEFQGCAAGSVLPLRATGARDASDSSAPAAGEILFLQ